ncbi:hypothetical protein RXV95_10300 [Novosphingobium sp. ZN18A2]|uniref:S53 family peptidase n=1 Tax=Novosphingobium sp. ZN18A2 TaxID=3079861 RepID=UPI0030CDB229
MKIARWGQTALGVFAAVVGLGALGAGSAYAQNAHANPRATDAVQRSGNVYHKAVCSHSITLGMARCDAQIRTDARGEPFKGKPGPGPGPNTNPAGYGPTDLRTAYAVTASGSSATTIAIVDAYGYPNAETDLGTYRSQFGLPACTTANGCFKVVGQTGSSNLPRYNSGWAQEQALDLDMASAMCPNCKILLVQASSASFTNLATAVNTAAALGAKVISNSYGGGESGSSSYAAYYNHPGVAVTASAGDSGYGAQFPATAPGVIAIGGTTLTKASNTRGFTETVWSGTGSGCSAVFAKPSWQTDTLCTTRMETDISAVADPSTGVAVYGPTGRGKGSAWLVFGGTSVSAPLIGGIYGALGVSPNAAQKIWTASSSAFNDVTSGNNGSCGGTYFCTAGAGYDGPTGRGTPAGSAAF